MKQNTNNLYINEVQYEELLQLIRKKRESNCDSDNIEFELEILMHSLTHYAQYDEDKEKYLLPMTEQNKDRLIGFLLDMLF